MPVAVADIVAAESAGAGVFETVNWVAFKILTILVLAGINPPPAVRLTLMPGNNVAVLATVTVVPLLEPPGALPVIVVPFFFQS